MTERVPKQSRAHVTGAVPTVGWEYASGPQAAHRPLQLPPDLPTFTGREGYLVELDRLLWPGAAQTTGLVWLLGMAGVGKSALAVHAAHRWDDRFRDGIVWVDLCRLDVASALRHIAATYGYRDQAAQEPHPEGLAALVRTMLRRREALIILDNAGDVPPDQFPLLLPGATSCVMLVTTRSSFAELARHGPVLRVGRMSEGEGGALLARILGPAADKVEETARGRLVERLDGLPLALDVAARRMAESSWGASGYLDHLEETSSLMAELSPALSDRGRKESVALAFAPSYEALDERHQQLFLALGVMAEGGSAPASVAGVLGEEPATVEQRLKELSALSLVRPAVRLRPGRRGGTGQYQLHPLLADYSRMLAQETGEWEELRAAHLEYYVAYAQRHTRDYPALEAELDNLMAAAEWSWKSGENNGVLALTQSLYVGGGKFLALQGRAREAVRLLTGAMEAAQALENRQHEGMHLSGLANAYADLGQYERAIECFRQALVISQEIGDRRGEGNVLDNLGLAYADLGQYEQATECFQQAVAITREISDRRGEGNVLDNLGLTYANLGQYEQAIECFRQALVISREVGDRRREGNTLRNLGLAYADLGQYEQAIECFRQALVISRGIGARRGEGNILGNLGLVYADLGQHEQAIECFQQALVISREIGDQRSEGAWLDNLTNTLTKLATPDLGWPNTLEQIATIGERLASLPLEMPQELEAILSPVRRVAQRIQAAVESNTLYNRWEQLERALPELQRIRQGLTSVRVDWFLARFGPVLDVWEKTIDHEIASLRQMEAEEAPIPNIYVPGPPLVTNSRIFKGRRDLFLALEQGLACAAAQPPALLVFGSRRSGKTSVLKQLPIRLGPDYIPVEVDLQSGIITENAMGLLGYIARQIREKALRHRELRLPALDREVLVGDPYMAFLDWLQEVEEGIGERLILLSLDEYERLEEMVQGRRLDRRFFHLIRGLIQHHPKLVVLLSGSHFLEDLAPLWSDYLINVQVLQVGPLARPDARELIERPIEEFPVEYEGEAVEHILTATGCQPYLVQAVCRHLVDRLNYERRHCVSLTDAEQALASCLESCAPYFVELWTGRDAGDVQRTVLTILAKHDESPVPEAVLARQIGRQELHQALRLLLRRDILEHADGGYGFRVELVADWVRQRAPLVK